MSLATDYIGGKLGKLAKFKGALRSVEYAMEVIP